MTTDPDDEPLTLPLLLEVLDDVATLLDELVDALPTLRHEAGDVDREHYYAAEERVRESWAAAAVAREALKQVSRRPADGTEPTVHGQTCALADRLDAVLDRTQGEDGFCTCHPDQRGRTRDCGIRAHRTQGEEAGK